MDKVLLKNKLARLGVKEEEYSLEGDLNPNTIVLYRNYSKWEVFYLDERGGRDMLHVSFSEDDACSFIYQYFIKRVETKKRFGLN